MKAVLVFAGLSMVSMLVLAGEKVDKKLKASSDGYVEIEHVSGYVNIKGWDENEVQVKGELGDRTKEFIFERNGNEVVIKVKTKKYSGWGGWGSDDGDDLEIMVPEGSKISYSSVNANVDVKAVYGGSDVDTVNGNIAVSDLSGRVRLESVNGNIDAQRISGDLAISTVNGNIDSENNNGREDQYESVNGNIDITSQSREMRAETVNGSLQMNMAEVSHLYLNTVNGDIEAKMTLMKEGEVKASSVGGGIKLYFQPNVSAHFDLEAHAGGSISNGLSSHKMQKAKYGPNRWLEFALNGGNGKVEVSTVSGRIKVDEK